MKKNKIIKVFMCLYLVMFGFKTIVLADTSVECSDWGRAKQDMQNLFNLLKIIIPLLVIGLSSYDFIKAITSKEDKGLKKAFNTFLKRLGYAVIFFFLPTIINLLMDLVADGKDICIE